MTIGGSMIVHPWTKPLATSEKLAGWAPTLRTVSSTTSSSPGETTTSMSDN